ncbi:MAG TPA: TonB-dependent receptor [Opitutaceae bacterium]|nr:TonB-dependent receptor [Opitutaceae bacterium]
MGTHPESSADKLRVLLAPTLLIAVLGLPVPIEGQSADAGQTAVALKQLSVEELMNIEVTSVSMEPEKLLDAASAIQVVTNDEIVRSGSTSIPEALRLADNLEVAQQNSHDWAISARGFNANLANKLLVLIDGRAVYSPLYGGVEWNVQDYPMVDIQQIEVISGPGGTLWGANAVNGVINITTKAAKDTQGLYVETGVGNELENFSTIRFGGTVAPGICYRVYGEYTDRGGEVLADGSSVSDSTRMGRMGFRIDSDSDPATKLTLQGDLYSGLENLGTLGNTGLNGGNVLGRLTHTISSGVEISAQTYFDRTHISQPFAASPPAPPYFTGFPAAPLTDNLDTYDMDVQLHADLSERNKLVCGLEYRFTQEYDRDLSVVRFVPESLDQNLYSGFVQDDVKLSKDVSLTLGTKIEHNDYTGIEAEPSIRLRWNPAAGQMLWGAVSRAVRTPSRYDRDLEVVSGLVNAPSPYKFPTDFLDGSSSFESEDVICYELGYRTEPVAGLTGSVAIFYNVYSNLRSTTATTPTTYYPYPYPVYFQNNLYGETHGLEVSTTYQVLDWWRMHVGYDLLAETIRIEEGQTDATAATNETADPRNQAFLRSSMDLRPNLHFDLDLRWIGSLSIGNGPTGGPATGEVPSYTELNARLAWEINSKIELSVVGENLLHDHHPEYGFPGAGREEISRSIYGKVAWRY